MGTSPCFSVARELVAILIDVVSEAPSLDAVPSDPDASDPGPDEPPAEVVIDLVDMEDVVDAPKGTGPAVDSISRLEDAFGATVVEEVPRT